MKIRILAALMILTPGCAGLRNMAEKPAVVQEPEPITRIGFKATGNEPFWALEIEFDNIMKFTSLTEKYPELSFPLYEPASQGDMSLVRYRAKTYNAEMELAISRRECIDTMKGDLFPYAVTASISRSHNDDYTVFRGCGKYLGTYRLNDIWMLEKINGKPIDLPDSKKHPRLEVDLANKVISGYGGCNRFHGRGELVNNNLVTGNLMSTKMACPDTQDIEDKFLKTLSGKTLNFTISDDTMVMTDGKTELFFKRAD